MKLLLLRVSTVLAFIALLCAAAWGQATPTGTLTMKVTDSDKKAIAKADVMVKDDTTEEKPPITTKTNDDGRFTIQSLRSGFYTVTISAPNYKQTVVKNVEVKDNQPTEPTVALETDLTGITSTYIVSLILSLCGALILFLLDRWLRRKEVNDPTLIWLYLSLLSWVVLRVAQLLSLRWGKVITPERLEFFLYIFSPISNILFTMAAFQLSRVRDKFRDPGLQSWRNQIIIVVAVVSVIPLLLMWFLGKDSEIAHYMDAIVSLLALVALGAGFVYSFYKYDNQYMIWLTVITMSIFIMRQFYAAAKGPPPSWGPLYALFLADFTMLIMIFISVAVAWGLSDTSRLKPVGIPANVEVVSMFFDLRGSTRWANEIMESDFRNVGKFIDDLRIWAWDHASVLPCGRPNIVKFLGDGFMFVWETPDAPKAGRANAIIRLAYTLNINYLPWVKENDLPWDTPEGIGVGVDAGPAIRLTFENGSDDYLGSPMNMAAKMQNLARPHGVVIQTKVWKHLEDQTRAKFPKEAVLKLGDIKIPVRMTEDVELQDGEVDAK
jgi:class 3 adenylate cyclase